ncbi:nuclear transport factor 2 family protein [Peribacillus simplex]|uniref:Nuclear transport factor 2 family protein n=1 Tax=Peribacillus simplex TaxID=1478 RepID=A0A9X9ESI9_9BACI|nr:nuclear transport factor 2 family protein [Peribacillus simplex]PAL14842.1 bile acid 7-alpha-dehydratase [Peribacillus simplex]TKG98819.1 nuclear transport factor 2 family protein [Peribacillus simplex]TKH11103.1 nuclear transport factor 2 family protein [Peribacillus simplex]
MTQTNLEKRIEELENVRALRELVDNFSILADKKEVWKQTELFTKDATVDSYVNGMLTSSFNGTKEIGEAFEGFLANFETVYHNNGQHIVSINGNKAEGTLYCRVDLISSENGKKINNASAVSYKDEYISENGQWLIAKRTSTFVWNDRQELNQ